jgi:hypothetical protein
MRTWLDEGRVGPDSLVWREGWRDWQEAGQVFPQLGAGGEPSPDAIVTGSGSSSSRTAGGYPRAPRRRASPASNAIIITVLILAVIVLFVVFVFVLLNPPQSRAVPDSENQAVAAKPTHSPPLGLYSL